MMDDYGVAETGYSTYSDLIGHDQNEQEEFINSALPTIRQKASQHECIFIGWYELFDEPNAEPLPAEKEFGILKPDFTPKLGYNDLKNRFGEFT
jgi:hypothetical protein